MKPYFIILKLAFLSLLLLISCSRKIIQKENHNSSSLDKYINFSPTEFAELLGALQCEYHHLSFEIIEGNLENSKKAEKIKNEMDFIFELVQNKYKKAENTDSISLSLFKEELRVVYDSCIKKK